MPVFMPWPPAGLCTWAASPARNARPRRYERTWAWWISNVVSQCASVSRMPPARESATACTLSSVGSAVPASVSAMIRTRSPRMGNSRNVPSRRKKVCMDSRGWSYSASTSAIRNFWPLNEPSSPRPIWARTVLWLPSVPTT